MPDGFCSVGAFVNSPAIYRGVDLREISSPEGTTDICCPFGTGTKFSIIPRSGGAINALSLRDK